MKTPPAAFLAMGLLTILSSPAIATTPNSSAPPPSRECAESCPMDFDPVCGSNNKTYTNVCELGVAQCNNPALNITAATEGECSSPPSQAPLPPATPTSTTTTPASTPSRKCPTSCTKVFVPVCGSDGKTYANMCLLRQQQCRVPPLPVMANKATLLTLHHQGACK